MLQGSKFVKLKFPNAINFLNLTAKHDSLLWMTLLCKNAGIQALLGSISYIPHDLSFPKMWQKCPLLRFSLHMRDSTLPICENQKWLLF